MSEQDYTQLTLFPVASHASRSVLPGSEEARRMTATSGQRCSELLRSSDPLSSLARMLLVSSRWQSQLVTLQWKVEALTAFQTKTTTVQYQHDKTECCSMVSCKTSVTSVIKSKHLLFRLVPQMPRTVETDSPLWATPNTMDSLPSRSYEAMKRQATTGGRKNRKRPSNLREQIDPLMCQAYDEAHVEVTRMWPTPRAKEDNDYQLSGGKRVETLQGAVKARDLQAVERGSLIPTPTTDSASDRKGRYKQGGMPLAAYVHMWPTCQARDWKGPQGRSYKGEARDLCSAVMWPTPTTGAGLCGGTGNYEQLKRLETDGTINNKELKAMSQSGGQLNPTWVEWLMGFPLGWTDIEQEMTIEDAVYDPHWYDAEPVDVPRVATGVAHRVDKLKANGNAVDDYQFFPLMEAVATILNDLKGGRVNHDI